MARFAGFGVGSAMLSLVPFSLFTYYIIAYFNAATFAVAAILLLTIRLPKELKKEELSDGYGSWARVFNDRHYLFLCGVHFFLALASVSKYSILPILVKDVLNAPIWIAGIALTMGTFVMVVFALPINRFAWRWSRSTALLAATLIYVMSFLSLATLTWVSLPVATVIIFVVATTMAIAEALFAPVYLAAAAEAAPSSAKGRSSALFQLTWSLAGTVAPIMLTSLLALGNAVLWLTLALLVALAIPGVMHLRHIVPQVLCVNVRADRMLQKARMPEE